MSGGRSVRNAISVEPGLPKIVVIPCRRMTSNAASRTVAPAGALPERAVALAALAVPATGVDSVTARILLARARSASVRMPNERARRGDGRQTYPELRFRAVARTGSRGDPRLRRRAPRARAQRRRPLDRPDARRRASLLVDAREARLRQLLAGPLLAAPARARARATPTCRASACPRWRCRTWRRSSPRSTSRARSRCSTRPTSCTSLACPTRRIMSITLAVGTRLPAFVTSMGRVLLAGLPDDELEERLQRIEIVPLTSHTVKDKDALRAILATVRRQGYAATDQELEEGLRSLAAPLRNASGDGHRRAESVRPREPRLDGCASPRLPPAGSADRVGDRGGSEGNRGSARLVRPPGFLSRLSPKSLIVRRST